MAIAEEHDYYQHLRYPKKLVPGIGLNDVEQEGGPDVVGYRRRTRTVNLFERPAASKVRAGLAVAKNP
jgi:hypothetical protein